MGRKRSRKRIKRWHPPGTLPGTLVAHVEAGAEPPQIHMFSYGPDRCEERVLRPEEIPSLVVPENGVLWLDIWGLSDPGVVKAVGDRFGFHPLALEDVLNIPQRPKVDRYENHLLVILREVSYPVETEQVSLFLSDRLVVTFQERPGDPFDPIRDRLRKGSGRIRSLGADYLLYSLCDAVVDSIFPTLEKLGEEVETLEETVIGTPTRETLREIRGVKKQLLEIRRAIWPARDAMSELLREDSPLIRPETRVFLRDCYDHTIQVMDMVETYREMAASLVDEYISSVSNRMNEIMKVLTIMATIFIPLTFIAGVYGMNFDREASPFNMPELGWRYGYPFILLVMAATAGGLVWYFRKKKWF
ncbi:MAG TPA: magnesium/cobalt transporter CorA [Candidatus Deferrimicrobiaceae bacterium]|jgi:magnesium transporter|nr:magnesium/cobalt transporter CorA [Candidatus Deferrimicrobiaceae bacterium]